MTTLFELPFDQFSRVQPLFADAPFDQPCYDSVFEGTQAARIFAEDAEMPTAALMCRSYEYYLAGNVAPALRRFVADAPQEAEVFGSFYGYVPLNHAWKAALLSDAAYEVIGRLNFQWTPGTPIPDWRAELPDTGRIVPIDVALAQRLDRECYPVPFILYDWGSYEAYARDGYGFALMLGDSIASTITASVVSRRHALVTIATEPPFRRRGFAALVGACFVEATLERGLLPVWDTDDTNLGSAATARRVGFTEQAPFAELALPNRAKPTQTLGLWSAETQASGVTVWSRA